MTMSSGVIACDPGKITGLAFWRDGVLQNSYQMPLMQAMREVQRLLGLYRLVVCESFTITANTLKTARDHSALDGIGVLKWLCWNDQVPFKLQSPGQAKRFATDEKLKKLGWYHATEGGHENDALRHLLVHLVDTKEMDLAVLI